MTGLTTPETTALIIVDLQNDFLHANGAYGRAGQTAEAIAALPEKVKPVADALRNKGGTIIATGFTLVPGRTGEPMIAPHLKQLRPFLKKGDFVAGGWGHSLVDELQPAHFMIEKVAYSAFYQTRLEWVLRKCGIDTLVFAGIVTNGGVASTVRDAHVRDFTSYVLTDGCAAFRIDTHEAALADLSTIAHAMTCAEAESLLKK